MSADLARAAASSATRGEASYRFVSSCNLPTQAGVFEMRVYQHSATGQDAIAMVARARHGGVTPPLLLSAEHSGPLFSSPSSSSSSSFLEEAAASITPGSVVLRVQDQCVTSEIFGSLKCDCKQQLDFSLALLALQAQRRWKGIEEEARGVTGSKGEEEQGSSSAAAARSAAASSAVARDLAGGSHLTRALHTCVAECTCEEAGRARASRTLPSTAAAAASAGGRAVEGSVATSAASAETSDSEGERSSALSTASSSGSVISLVDAVPPHSSGAVRGGGDEGEGEGGKERGGATSAAAAGDASAPLRPSSTLSKTAAADEIVGLVVYLLQEGRGIGLAAKVSAYALQEAREEEGEDDDDDEDDDEDDGSHATGQRVHRHADDNAGRAGGTIGDSSASAAAGVERGKGKGSRGSVRGSRGRGLGGLDTVDANRALGLPDDVREYSAVRDILRDLHLMAEGSEGEESPAPPLLLLTNNPRKVALLGEGKRGDGGGGGGSGVEATKGLGIPIAKRIPCHIPPLSPLAAAYLRTKAERMGHDIPAKFFGGAAGAR